MDDIEGIESVPLEILSPIYHFPYVLSGNLTCIISLPEKGIIVWPKNGMLTCRVYITTS
jgi:hypothetical protein